MLPSSHPARALTCGVVHDRASQVFAHFDEFSYELSKLDLKHFRQNAMRNAMAQASAA